MHKGYTFYECRQLCLNILNRAYKIGAYLWIIAKKLDKEKRIIGRKVLKRQISILCLLN